MHPKSVWVKIALSIVILVALLVAFATQIAHGQAIPTLHIQGTSDQVVFRFDPALSNDHLTVVWGVANQIGQQQVIQMTNGQAIVNPPTGTVSVQLQISGVNIVTCFPLLNNENWYAVPAAQHDIFVSGNADSIAFSANYNPTGLNVTWGISGKPAITQSLVFTSQTTTVNPPTGTVSMLFAPPGVTISTTFSNLGSGWYAVPAAVRTIAITGNSERVVFTADYEPANLSVTWGVSGKSAVTQPLSFTNRIATTVPPAGTVSILFAPPGVTISTTFSNLGGGWYAVPAIQLPTLNHKIFLPLTFR